MFWRLDRFSREGALATLRYLQELRDHGVKYKSFTEPYLDSLGPFGDVIASLLATIAAQDLIKISENTKAALTKKKVAGVQLGAPTKSIEVIRTGKAVESRWCLEPSNCSCIGYIAQHSSKILAVVSRLINSHLPQNQA